MSTSTAEAELVAMHDMIKDSVRPLAELAGSIIPGSRVNIYCDNQAAVAAILGGFSMKLRHLSRTHKVHIAFLKEFIDAEKITLRDITSSRNPADIFTKALHAFQFQEVLKILHSPSLPRPQGKSGKFWFGRGLEASEGSPEASGRSPEPP